MYFAGRLKELREKAGLTQGQLAELVGLTKGGVADFEQGRRLPTWTSVLALAQALGVTCLAFTEPPAERPPSPRGRPTGKRPEGKDHQGEAKPKPCRGRNA